MNKPSKKQLTDSVTYFQTSLTEIVNSPDPDYTADAVLDLVRNVLSSQPSLEPQSKAVVVEKTAVVNVSEDPASV